MCIHHIYRKSARPVKSKTKNTRIKFCPKRLHGNCLSHHPTNVGVSRYFPPALDSTRASMKPIRKNNEELSKVYFSRFIHLFGYVTWLYDHIPAKPRKMRDVPLSRDSDRPITAVLSKFGWGICHVTHRAGSCADHSRVHAAFSLWRIAAPYRVRYARDMKISCLQRV